MERQINREKLKICIFFMPTVGIEVVLNNSFAQWYDENASCFNQGSEEEHSDTTVLDLSEAGSAFVINFETDTGDGTHSGTVEFLDENGEPVAWGHFDGVDSIVYPEDTDSHYYSLDDFTIIGEHGEGLPPKISLDNFLDENCDTEMGGSKGSGSGGSKGSDDYAGKDLGLPAFTKTESDSHDNDGDDVIYSGSSGETSGSGWKGFGATATGGTGSDGWQSLSGTATGGGSGASASSGTKGSASGSASGGTNGGDQLLYMHEQPDEGFDDKHDDNEEMDDDCIVLF